MRRNRVWRLVGLGAGGLLCLSGCTGQGYDWDLHVILPTNETGQANFFFLIRGIWLTLEISLLSVGFGVIFGLLIAFLGLSRFTITIFQANIKVYALFQLLIRVYLEVIRNLPIFVLMLWAYFAMPIISPFDIGPYEAVVFTLSTTAAAFFSEIFRAGIESIDRGHIEAGRSLGMSSWQTMRRIVLPQAIRRVLPPITSEFVIIVKGSSLGAFVGLTELARRAFQINATLNQSRTLEVYTFLAVEYLIFLVILSRLFQWLEKKTAIP
ncbi:Glutamine transport system permease protein GlnP [Candidatus Entotheonellaceae bacterium PAL068K]